MYTLFLLLLPPGSADAALDRYVALKKATPNFEVGSTCRINNGPAATTTLRVEQPSRLLYLCRWEKSDYKLSITESGTVETEGYNRVYDEHPDQVGLRIYSSRISPGTRTFPFPLLFPDLRKMIRAKFVSEGSKVVDGVRTDVVYAHAQSQQGESSLRAWIDRTGRLVEVESSSQAIGTPRITYDWHFGPLKPLRRTSVAAFKVPLPSGYVPYALDDPGNPIAVGQKLSSVPGRGKKVLVAVVDSSAPSRRALASLKNLEGAGISVVRVNETSAVAKQAHAPATPFFMLVGSDGTIKNEWLGYDPSKSADFEKQVRDAAAS